MTIRKKNKHVIKLSKELTAAREKLRRAESRSGSSSDDDDKDKGERPSEDVVERMEDKLEAAQADPKNLFLIIFQVSHYVKEKLFKEFIKIDLLIFLFSVL